jgi:hypothetical protein
MMSELFVHMTVSLASSTTLARFAKGDRTPAQDQFQPMKSKGEGVTCQL